MAVYLVCEGSLDGLDRRVIDGLVIQRHNLLVQIEPVGGSSGHGAVRSYLEQRSQHSVAISIEDRDYRPATAAGSTWINQAGKRFLWRRHEIENYLLQPRVVLELFNDFRASAAVWANALPANEADTSALLQALAAPLLDDHAAQVLRCDIVGQINGIGSLSFGPPAPAPAAGAHAPAQAEWLAALQNEASRLCQTCADVAVLAGLQSGAIMQSYNALMATFHNPAFLISGDYLNEMAGRDILAALSRHLHRLHAPTALNQSVLADELLRVLVGVYQSGGIYQPDDFAELASILRQY